MREVRFDTKFEGRKGVPVPALVNFLLQVMTQIIRATVLVSGQLTQLDFEIDLL
jgi:hypothetical protein